MDDIATNQASVAEAIARCEKPDLLLRIAYQDATEKRRYVLGRGADIAMGFRGPIASAAAFIAPWPFRLEAIKIWAGDNDDNTGGIKGVRARATAWFAAIAVASAGDQLIWGAGLSNNVRGGIVSVLFVVLGVLFTPVFRFTWMRSLRRQCAHFEELAALEIVVAHLVEGAAKRPSRVPWVLYLLRGAVDFLFQPDNKSPKSPFPDIPYPPDRRRSWTARFDRHDPARDICYYRVQLFRRNRAAGELYVEIPAGFARLHAGKLKELQTQLARVIATGKSNVLPQP